MLWNKTSQTTCHFEHKNIKCSLLVAKNAYHYKKCSCLTYNFWHLAYLFILLCWRLWTSGFILVPLVTHTVKRKVLSKERKLKTHVVYLRTDKGTARTCREWIDVRTSSLYSHYWAMKYPDGNLFGDVWFFWNLRIKFEKCNIAALYPTMNLVHQDDNWWCDLLTAAKHKPDRWFTNWTTKIIQR